MTLSDQLDQLLPQTQCQRCGYPACRPYAEAMARGDAPPNLCPPGQQDGADRLARLLGVATQALDPDQGLPGVTLQARIVEDHCIGCTKCIRACPVDAIIGAHKRMHTVISERCTGCELCIPPCPTDCIVLEPRPETLWQAIHIAEARLRYEARQRRLARLAAQAPGPHAGSPVPPPPPAPETSLGNTTASQATRPDPSAGDSFPPAALARPDFLARAMEQARKRLASARGKNDATQAARTGVTDATD